MDIVLAVIGTLLICFIAGLVVAARWYFNRKTQAVDAVLKLAHASGNYLLELQKGKRQQP